MTRRQPAGMPPIYVDFLFLLVLAFVLLINPPTNDGEVAAPGNMTVAITWPAGPQDVDLWMRGPGERPVGYSNKSGRVHNLLRDDLGVNGDILPANMEHGYSRGVPAGEYVYAAHCYSCGKPVTVNFEIRKGAPGARQKLLFQGAVTLQPAQERALVRFRLDVNGNVVPGSVSEVAESLRGK